jgi:hypothetical protein
LINYLDSFTKKIILLHEIDIKNSASNFTPTCLQ